MHYTLYKILVKFVAAAVSEYHLVTVTKMYSEGHHLPQISLKFHQVFSTV